MFYQHKTNRLIRSFYPSYFVWDLKKKEEKKIYLTFDDGPIPYVTEFILKELAKYNAKATFFAVGSFVEKNPDEVRALFEAGNEIANHSDTHAAFSSLDRDGIKKEIEERLERKVSVGALQSALIRLEDKGY